MHKLTVFFRGESPANKTITEATSVSPSLSERWASLTDGQRTGIYVGAASFVAIIAGVFLWYFLKQRRRGKEEARLAAEREKREQMELNQFHAAGIDPDSFTVQHADGNPNPFATPAHSIHEKQRMQSSAAAAGVGAGVAAPLLREDPRNPHSPNMNDGQQQQYFDQPPNSGGMRSPSGSPAGYPAGPGGPPRGPPSPALGSPAGYPHPDRSATAPVNRMNSPGPMNGPQRSFTNDSYRGPGGHPQQGNNGWR